MLIYQCKSVQDLLLKCHHLAMEQMSGCWHFRGQGDSRWTLKPSLLRDPRSLGIKDPAEFERLVLKYLQGIIQTRTVLPSRFADDENALLALAQHYGVKTRLLDWTLDPAVAVYFGASSALPRVSNGDALSFSVFAMPAIYLNVRLGKSAEFVTPPRAANPNLVAQKGLFSKHPWDSPDLWDAAGAVTRTGEPAANVSAKVETRLVRLDLSYLHASDALGFLHSRLGISAATLFPGEHGLVKFAEDLARSDQLVAARYLEKAPLVLSDDGQRGGEVAARPVLATCPAPTPDDPNT